eukprot:GDKJ01035608.1.p1 GENE.GDKJ01035608.1~~GDKJ01035608.1.p1  ORF type:complete len:364 (+),score=37.17 GDKJ01035608.1:30-1121(+)
MSSHTNDAFQCAVVCFLGMLVLRCIVHYSNFKAHIKMFITCSIVLLSLFFISFSWDDNIFKILDLPVSLNVISKDMVRKIKHHIAMNLHPDRPNGNADMFSIANKALETLSSQSLLNEYVSIGDYSAVDQLSLNTKIVFFQTFIYWSIAICVVGICTQYFPLSEVAAYKAQGLRASFSITRIAFIVFAIACFSKECELRSVATVFPEFNLTGFEVCRILRLSYPAVCVLLGGVFCFVPWLLGSAGHYQDVQTYYMGGIEVSNLTMRKMLEDASSSLDLIKRFTKVTGHSIEGAPTIRLLQQNCTDLQTESSSGRTYVGVDFSQLPALERFRLLWETLDAERRDTLKNLVMRGVREKEEEAKKE